MIGVPNSNIGGALVAAAWLLGTSLACAQAPGSAPADDSALVTRGEYLARAADCMPCHTSDKSKPYAGGLALNTPFGAIYSVNITSDPTTGIGRWTYDQFKRALHDGIRADGAFLYPAMPFDAYTGIEEADLKALWAYVRRIPPAAVENTENGLSFPFNIRLGMLAWRELFFAPASFKPTPGKSAEWNRGAYLVEALGHCSDCHSPRNILGGIKGKAQFTGADIDGFYAPDIASAALAKNWTKDTLVQFLKTGSAPQKTVVFGPMAEVDPRQPGLSDRRRPGGDGDLSARQPAAAGRARRRRSSRRCRPGVYKRAAKLYIDNCAACHQDHGTGVANRHPAAGQQSRR